MKSIFFSPIRNKKNILANFWIKRFSAPRFFTCAWVMLDSRSIWHVLINFKCLQSLFKCLQTYFSFIHSYINYKNIPWARTNKTKVRKQFGNQKQAARIIFNQDRLTHARPLLKTLNALNVLSNKFAASTSVHAQDKNKLIPSNLPTSGCNNKS